MEKKILEGEKLEKVNGGGAQYDVDQKACIGCGICTFSCPAKAITLKNNSATIDYNLCTLCGTCANSCPVGAISKHTTGLAR